MNCSEMSTPKQKFVQPFIAGNVAASASLQRNTARHSKKGKALSSATKPALLRLKQLVDISHLVRVFSAPDLITYLNE